MSEEGSNYRRTFRIELANPTEEDLASIRNRLVERIARSVTAEELAPGSVDQHDKHDSFYTKDPGVRIAPSDDVLTPADTIVQPDGGGGPQIPLINAEVIQPIKPGPEIPGDPR